MINTKLAMITPVTLLFLISPVWSFPLTISVGAHAVDGDNYVSAKLEVLGKETEFSKLDEAGQTLQKIENIKWQDLKGIALSSFENNVTIKPGNCSNSRAPYINKNGQKLNDAKIVFQFDFIKANKYQTICNMSASQYVDTSPIPIYAVVDKSTKPREVTFTVGTITQTKSLSTNALSLDLGYKTLSGLLNAVNISTKKTIGTAKGKCPGIKNFQNEKGQILKSVTYVISYTSDLTCTAQLEFVDIPE